MHAAVVRKTDIHKVLGHLGLFLTGPLLARTIAGMSPDSDPDESVVSASHIADYLLAVLPDATNEAAASYQDIALTASVSAVAG